MWLCHVYLMKRDFIMPCPYIGMINNYCLVYNSYIQEKMHILGTGSISLIKELITFSYKNIKKILYSFILKKLFHGKNNKKKISIKQIKTMTHNSISRMVLPISLFPPWGRVTSPPPFGAVLPFCGF